jgi:histidine phosphotransferase ChpT
MSVQVDISILELLSSKICHDLISPIGAVNNGIEFMTEMGADAGDEATDLIAFSAQQASAKLQAFRMAYGAGGADGSLKPEDVHKSIQAIIGAEDKLTQSWDPYGELGYEDRPDAFCKILICAMLLAMECLPKGGELVVSAGDQTGQTLVKAGGENAGIRNMMEEALALDIHKDELEPKHVHAYMTGLLAQAYDFKVSVSVTDTDSVILLLELPSA